MVNEMNSGSRHSSRGAVHAKWFRACKYVTTGFFTIGFVTGGAISVVIGLELFYQHTKWNADNSKRMSSTNPINIYQSSAPNEMTRTSHESKVSHDRSNRSSYLNSSESQYCLYKSNEKYNWDNALAQCQALGMQLPVIETIEEFYNLKAFIFHEEKLLENSETPGSPWFWIGGKTTGEYDETVWNYAKGRHLKRGFVDHVCVNIEISDIQQSYVNKFKGVYVIQPKSEWCEDKHPTYKHILHDFYLYWYADSFYWMVSQESCSGYGWISADTNSTSPLTDETGNIWKEWIKSKSQWTFNIKLKIKCVYMSSGEESSGSTTYCIQLRKTGYFQSLCNETAHVLCEQNSTIYL